MRQWRSFRFVSGTLEMGNPTDSVIGVKGSKKATRRNTGLAIISPSNWKIKKTPHSSLQGLSRESLMRQSNAENTSCGQDPFFFPIRYGERNGSQGFDGGGDGYNELGLLSSE